ncbi:secretin and TonB N-terminal domain-containing protein [Candidatus Poribacteria bacterium]|nr:secretin and TonB N-terminal domain-containing protein [Candidatus Poribacteria bacterium]
MGSLVRIGRSGFLLTAAAILALAGLLLPPQSATANSSEQKLRLLEGLGLDGSDPTVAKAARDAQTLYGAEVLPNASGARVVIRLSGLPSYKSYFFDENRKLVIDLQDTVDLSSQIRCEGGASGPVHALRASQFKLSPTLVSRVVVELDEGATSRILREGNNLVVVATARESAVAVKPVETPVRADEVIAVPPVQVNTAVPESGCMFANAEGYRSAAEYAFAVDEKYTHAAVEPETATTPVPTAETNAAAVVVAEAAHQTPGQPAAETKEDVSEAKSKGETAPAVCVRQADSGSQPVAAAEAVRPASSAPRALVAMATQAAVQPMVAQANVAGTNGYSEKSAQLAQAPAEEAEQETDVPAESAALESEGLVEEETPQGVVSSDKHVTLVFRDADLSAVLDILARQGNLNILAGNDVKGTVTVRLVDVPLETALNAILNVNGYGFVKTNNIVRILPLSKLGGEVQTITQTYVLSYAEATKAKTTLQKFLTPNGNIEVDERTNMLIVTDIPGNMERINELIPQMDKRVRQVLIEVLILDSVLGDSSDLGIQWSLFNSDDNSPHTTNGDDSIDVTLPIANQAIEVSFGTLMGDIKLDAVVQALVENRDSKVLANPKVLTLNNETASIEIIREIPYDDVTQTSQGGQLSNITFKEVGTKLEVKPQITHDDHVILHIKPEQNFDTGETLAGVPIIDTRRAETTLIVRNNQTIVLGGLRRTDNARTVTKVPFFGDLPVAKYAFRNVDSTKNDTELLVFITVHIVESPPLLAGEKIKFDEMANMPRKPSASIELIR